MDLRWTWLAWLLALSVLACLGLWFVVWRRPQPPHDGVLVANATRLRALPRYRQVVRRQLIVTLVQVGAVVLVITGAVLLAARPTSMRTEDPEPTNGDIVLCLDASPTMNRDNIDVLAQARSVLDELQGERIGLFVFYGATSSLMPLTDDYGYARKRLHDAQEAFARLDQDYLAGAATESGGTAQVGNGLVSCAQHFDRPLAERGRAIVLASANDRAEAPVYTVREAGEYAEVHDVVVYGLAPSRTGVDALGELRRMTRLTGGRMFELTDSTSGSVQRIRRMERRRLDEPQLQVRSDDPARGTVLIFVGLGMLLLAGVRWQE